MNETCWAYNMPLQVRPRHRDEYDERTEMEGARILNYMPRKERCEWIDLEECIDGQTREEFFEAAAQHLENLAGLMREAARDRAKIVYYHDKGMER